MSSGLCACGCGQQTGEGKSYVRFHHSRLSAEMYVVDKKTGCWVWQRSRSVHGYARMKVDGQVRYGHRVMYERANGPIPKGLHLDHLCRNPACVNPDHLEAVTPAENSRRNPGHKLTPQIAKQIREVQGSHSSIAGRFGVSRTTVYKIRSGRMWREDETRTVETTVANAE